MPTDTVKERLLDLEPAVCDAVNAMAIAVDYVEHLLNRAGITPQANAGVYALHQARNAVELLQDKYEDACRDVSGAGQ